MTQIIERLYETRIGPYEVRIWFGSRSLFNLTGLDVGLENWLLDIFQDAPSSSGFISRIANMEDVNAVQVKGEKESVIIYNDWP